MVQQWVACIKSGFTFNNHVMCSYTSIKSYRQRGRGRFQHALYTVVKGRKWYFPVIILKTSRNRWSKHTYIVFNKGSYHKTLNQNVDRKVIEAVARICFVNEVFLKIPELIAVLRNTSERVLQKVIKVCVESSTSA